MPRTRQSMTNERPLDDDVRDGSVRQVNDLVKLEEQLEVVSNLLKNLPDLKKSASLIEEIKEEVQSLKQTLVNHVAPRSQPNGTPAKGRKRARPDSDPVADLNGAAESEPAADSEEAVEPPAKRARRGPAKSKAPAKLSEKAKGKRPARESTDEIREIDEVNGSDEEMDAVETTLGEDDVEPETEAPRKGRSRARAAKTSKTQPEPKTKPKPKSKTKGKRSGWQPAFTTEELVAIEESKKTNKSKKIVWQAVWNSIPTLQKKDMDLARLMKAYHEEKRQYKTREMEWPA